jgi:hypothetical protein
MWSTQPFVGLLYGYLLEKEFQLVLPFYCHQRLDSKLRECKATTVFLLNFTFAKGRLY